MKPPFLISSDFHAIASGLYDPAVEGLIWKSAVPSEVIEAITSFDHERFCDQTAEKPCRQSKRAQEGTEWEIHGRLGERFPELACVDTHTIEVASKFRSIARPNCGMARGENLAIHFVSSTATKNVSQRPHIDPVTKDRICHGILGSEWNKIATAGYYPFYKLVVGLNEYNDGSTILIPSEDVGEADPDRPSDFPSADLTNSVQAEPGDISILKLCVTAHVAPASTGPRWFTVY